MGIWGYPKTCAEEKEWTRTEAGPLTPEPPDRSTHLERDRLARAQERVEWVVAAGRTYMRCAVEIVKQVEIPRRYDGKRLNGRERRLLVGFCKSITDELLKKGQMLP